ncbi:mpv17-like protein 2 [Oppia nitens]|uniref:mpv17-like protein 2 n=1 Tax=Oppia nitens TaxID=1686743 RepID=UPI0023D9E77A|nr:mpv17-like protein 2 [Oppia nitens]
MSFRTLIGKLFSPNYLLATNAVSGTVFLLVGDAVQQTLERRVLRTAKTTDFDKQRFVAMSFGGLYFGIFGHFWYLFLDRRFPPAIRHSLRNKLLCEAAVGPPFAATLFYLVGTVEQKSPRHVTDQLRSSLPLLCAADWLVFIPVQFLNFRYFAPKFRFVFVAVISLFYDTFLSFILHQ